MPPPPPRRRRRRPRRPSGRASAHAPPDRPAAAAQGRPEQLLHTILPDGSHQASELPPSPARSPPPPPPPPDSLASMLADLQFLSQPSDRFLLPPRALALLQQQQRGPGAQLRTSFRRGPDLRGGDDGPARRAEHGRRSGRDGDGGPAAAAAGGGGGGGGLQQPRPYFYRIQRSVATGLASRRGGGDGDGGGCNGGGAPSAALWPAELAGSRPSAPADPALAARRAVYEEGRWALPLAAGGGGGAPDGGGGRAQLWGAAGGGAQLGPAQERRLGEWLTRELRALLLEADVALVAAFVLGLVRSYGLQRELREWAGGPGGGGAAAAAAAPAAAGAPAAAAASASGPVAGLRPFLFDHAEHFYHELRAFALSGLPLAAYDARARYGGPPGLPEPRAPREPVAEGGLGGRGRRSRWDRPAEERGAQAEHEPRQCRRERQRHEHEQRRREDVGEKQRQAPGGGEHEVVVIDGSPERAAAAATAAAPAPLEAAEQRAAEAARGPSAGGGGLLKRAALEAARRLQALQAS